MKATIPTVSAPFTILVDGREKAPYTFTGLTADANKNHKPLVVPTKWAHLKTGDYTIEGMESLVAVERKSLADLYSTLGQHRERFEAEHERLAGMTFAVVVIEASWTTILTCPPERSKLLPKCIFRTAVSWMQTYGVPWLAMDDRHLAEITTFRLLEKFWQGEEERRKARDKKTALIIPSPTVHVPSSLSCPEASLDADTKEALEYCNQIIRLCDDVPERGEDFASSVADQVEAIRDTIAQMKHATEAQWAALENMHAGVSAWIR